MRWDTELPLLHHSVRLGAGQHSDTKVSVLLSLSLFSFELIITPRLASYGVTQVCAGGWRADIFLKCERVRPSILMKLWPEAAPPSIKHWKHKPRENTKLILSHRKAWAIPAGQLKSQPTVNLNFPHNSHVHKDAINLEKAIISDQFLFCGEPHSFLCQECAAFLSLFWPQESFPYSSTGWHFQQARLEDVFVSVCGLWESKFITKNAQQGQEWL